MNLTTRHKQWIVGGITAALVGAVTYLLGVGAIPTEWAVVVNLFLGGAGGVTAVKQS